MNSEDLTKNWYIETLVTDILYADLEAGNVDFLRMAYDKLGINTKRIMEMREMCPKISSKAINMMYEDIIGIITEELYQKGNVDLLMDLVDFYLQRFPCMKEQFDDCGHDVEKLLWDAKWIQESEPDNFVRQTFILLYCYTYGDDDVILDLIFNCFLEKDSLYPSAEYCAYEHKNMTADSCNWVEEAFHINDFKNSEMFKKFVKIQKGVLTDFCGVTEDIYYDDIYFEDFFVTSFTKLELYSDLAGGDLQTLFLLDRWNAICKKYHMNQLIVFKAEWQVYLNMFREIFEQMCMKEIKFLCCLNSDYDDDVLDIKLLEMVCMTEINNPEAFLTELMLTFWFECFLMSQKELYDEYYKIFSLGNPEADIEELRQENSRLKEELARCKMKLQQYTDADAGIRKAVQNNEGHE